MIKTILVATDGSKQAMKAVDYAVGLAGQAGASLLVLSVIDRSFLVAQTIHSSATPTKIRMPVEEYLKQAAEKYLGQAVAAGAKKKVRAKKVIKYGHPVEEIVKEARRSKADLIVIGSRGKSALKAAVLGSVAFGVIHKDTKVPVLVVRN
ncbi:MAG: hypothetical protein A2X56_02715 [Nitrospirae bacterium GWC2_57_13]|nr:MAG: hypothetical protein A2X56_02715 [Nitrospirae bacterium GWC2_57_13]HAS52888.1 hypothetical protein [Nitrospiraceae bacterium]